MGLRSTRLKWIDLRPAKRVHVVRDASLSTCSCERRYPFQIFNCQAVPAPARGRDVD